MNIAIVSYFHNSKNYLYRYLSQVDALSELLEDRGDKLTLVLGYGDDTDGTRQLLHEEAHGPYGVELVDVTHGGKVYGSVVDKVRFKQLAGIVNKLWDNIPEETDIVGYIESDLTWKPEALLRLIEGVTSLSDALQAPTLLSPLIMTAEGEKSTFYDTWAFRHNGRSFRARWPYHTQMRSAPEYLEMDSVGSCFFTQAELARKLDWPEEDVIVGLCRKARELGANVLLDTRTEVYHL